MSSVSASNEKQPNPKKDLEEMVSLYLATNPIIKRDRKENEMEIRFGTNTKEGRPISKIDYDNVIQYLYAAGFNCENKKGNYYLRINSEYIDQRTGITKMSNIRAEIVGVDLISEYCKTNSIQKILDMPSTLSARADKLKFTQKITPLRPTDKTPIRPVNFTDHNFRVAYQLEQDFSVRSSVARDIINKWMDSKKNFRHMNRVRFSHPTLPINADLSIVRTSSKSGYVALPQYTIQDANVFQNEPHYEIELELDNTKVGEGTQYNNVEKLLKAIRYCIRVVLSAIQGSAYPISFSEKAQTLLSYMKMIHGDEYQPRKDNRYMPKDFIGPSSVSLQMENIRIPDENSTEPNIRSGYAVTEKADGIRKLLYISSNGRVYLIDMNMNVAFTGAIVENKALHDTLIDGEHVLHDKHGNYINLYAAFDIYYVYKKSVKEFPFMKTDEESTDNKFRLVLLQKCIEMMKLKPIVQEGMEEQKTAYCNLLVKCKEFHSHPTNIFQACSIIIRNINENIYEYLTDGLIFTPILLGVGANRVGDECPKSKRTWIHSFKWKPATYNTVDFLVSVKKLNDGRDEIHTLIEGGTQLDKSESLIQYKTLILRCGYDEDADGYINPFQSVLDYKSEQNAEKQENVKTKNRYKPMPFIPTSPYNPLACYCNVELKKDGSNHLFMQTEEGEYFEEDMIVEFSHDPNAKEGWKWKPLRVRYDKTASLRSGASEYGNSYKTANSNWRSIYSPISEEMISTGNDIPEIIDNGDVYYSRGSKETNTQPLRDFHNLYVKRKLITGVSQRGNTLIDFAVGKGGDLPKWIDSKLGFVLGVDVSKDNINNPTNGVCARYLNSRKTNKYMFDGIFVHGNSGLNIRDGSAFRTDKEKAVAKALFGQGAKDKQYLGEAVYRNYGVAQDGFNVSSVQFALHYFFEDEYTFHSFMRNVSECTKVGGYFIGTCYDGKRVFELLRNKMKGESMTILREEQRIFQLTKQYDQTGFPEDEQSLNYRIEVYQESIGKEFSEYLVNFDFLTRMMENYGFTLVQTEEAQKLGLPNGNGSFSELFAMMENDIRRNPKSSSNYKQAHAMSEDEKLISFLNMYFVFRKTTKVNSEKMAKLLQTHDYLGESEDEEDGIEGISKITRKYKSQQPPEEGIILATPPVDKAPELPEPIIRKIDHPKIVIGEYEGVEDTPAQPMPEKIEVIPEQVTAPQEMLPSLSTQPNLNITAPAASIQEQPIQQPQQIVREIPKRITIKKKPKLVINPPKN
jgi:hypothetical protein